MEGIKFLNQQDYDKLSFIPVFDILKNGNRVEDVNIVKLEDTTLIITMEDEDEKPIEIPLSSIKDFKLNYSNENSIELLTEDSQYRISTNSDLWILKSLASFLCSLSKTELPKEYSDAKYDKESEDIELDDEAEQLVHSEDEDSKMKEEEDEFVEEGESDDVDIDENVEFFDTKEDSSEEEIEEPQSQQMEN